MFISENSKFRVGDSVILKDSRYRGGWLEHNLAGGMEIEYVGDDTSCPPKTTVTKVLKREEPSINGICEEYYYEVSGYPCGRFREDLLEGEDSDGSCIEYTSGFYASEVVEVNYRTDVKYFTEEEIQVFTPSVFESDNFNSENFFKCGEMSEGHAIVDIAGIWYDESTIELELYFTFDGSNVRQKVLAQGPASASSFKDLKFSAREAVGSTWGMPSFYLTESCDGCFALDQFCNSLEILEVCEIDTDEWC